RQPVSVELVELRLEPGCKELRHGRSWLAWALKGAGYCTRAAVADRDLAQHRQNAKQPRHGGCFNSLIYKENFGRGERIRTSGLYVPNVALYQAKLHPDGDASNFLQGPVTSGKPAIAAGRELRSAVPRDRVSRQV